MLISMSKISLYFRSDWYKPEGVDWAREDRGKLHLRLRPPLVEKRRLSKNRSQGVKNLAQVETESKLDGQKSKVVDHTPSALVPPAKSTQR